ncbi:MAG: hypothetical protein IKI26_00530 [Prevotella sp.]|nr:hypothetical protein [Prevotella sp.]
MRRNAIPEPNALPIGWGRSGTQASQGLRPTEALAHKMVTNNNHFNNVIDKREIIDHEASMMQGGERGVIHFHREGSLIFIRPYYRSA